MISIEIVEKTVRKRAKLMGQERSKVLIASLFRAVGGKAFVNKYDFNDEQMVTGMMSQNVGSQS